MGEERKEEAVLKQATVCIGDEQFDLSRIPPQFRKTYTPEELAERMR